MKFYIYLCCIVHLLTEISARLRLTTPMPTKLRSNDDAARQASVIAEMIDFINSVFNDNDRSIARSGRYEPMLRRFELPAVDGINLPASAVLPNDEGIEKQLDNLAGSVRYQAIDNPEVLEEYSNKQNRKNNQNLFTPVPVIFDNDTSAEAKSFNTVEKKFRYYQSKSNSNASQNSTDSNNSDQLYFTPHLNPLDGVQELTTVESTYRPSFPDDSDDDDDEDDGNKLVTEDKKVTVTENKINTPRTDEKSYGDKKINDTVKIEKRTLDNKALGKYQGSIDEEKEQMDDTKETGQIKRELLLKKDKNSDGVTVNEEKSGSNKEHNNKSTELDYNNNERPNKDKVRPRDEDYKNDGNKKINGTNSEEDKPIERSSDANKIINLPVERLIGRIDKSALRTKQKNNNHDYKKQHSIYSHKEINENSNQQFKNGHEKRDEYDRKKKDKNDDRWSKKEKDWNKIDKQRYNKNNGYDRMEYEWNKRHQQYDEYDNWNKNGNQWDKSDYFTNRYYDSNKRDDDWNERDNDWRETDIDSIKRDSDWNQRDDDWNKKDWRNQNERDKEYSDLSVENDGGISHEKYKILERRRKDGVYKRHSEV